LFDRIDAVKALGYDARFVRMWEFYLCYCEGGFLERSISDVHLLFARPGNRRTEFLPGEPACA
jgi:cyclopropane-fatty-acyl-phospholipid synthase